MKYLLLLLCCTIGLTGCGNLIEQNDAPTPSSVETSVDDDTVTEPPAGQNDPVVPTPTIPDDPDEPETPQTTAPTLPNLEWTVVKFYDVYGGYSENEQAAINEMLRRLKIIIASDEFVASVNAHYEHSQANPDMGRPLQIEPNVVISDIRNENRKLNFGKFSNQERAAAGQAAMAGLGSIGGNWIGFPVEYGQVNVSAYRAGTLFHEIMHNMGYYHGSGVPNIGNYVVHPLYKEFERAGRFDNDYFR